MADVVLQPSFLFDRHTGIDLWKRYSQAATSVTYGGQSASVSSTGAPKMMSPARVGRPHLRGQGARQNHVGGINGRE